MSKKARELSAEEKRLWRRVAAGVKPRKPQTESNSEEAVEFAEPRLAKAKPQLAIKPRTQSKPQAQLANRGGEKKVRRGNVDVAASLDLHGHTQDGALAALLAFLHGAHSRGARTVIVITGAGRGGEGVLKRRLPEWLALPGARSLVAGFAQAQFELWRSS